MLEMPKKERKKYNINYEITTIIKPDAKSCGRISDD